MTQFTMISSRPFMPNSDLHSTPYPIPRILSELPYWNAYVNENIPVRNLIKVFDEFTHLPGIMVFQGDEMLGLITRVKTYEKVGRPFGVELFMKLKAAEFYKVTGESTLVLTGEDRVDKAIQAALEREDRDLYEPFVINCGDEYRVISMYHLLHAQQALMEELNAEFKQLSVIDPLTNTNNRRGFFEEAQNQLEKVHGLNQDYSAILVDVDNFKAVNDRFGHLIGDEVLRLLTQFLQSNLGEKGILGRLGGEEFVILLIDKTEEATTTLATKLCSNLAGMFHSVSGYNIRITISAGISHSNKASSLDRLLSQADQAMYLAKQSGKNMAVVWNEKMMFKNETMFRSQPDSQPDRTGDYYEKTVERWLRLLDLRDYETRAHTQRVASLTRSLARTVGIPELELDSVYAGALLHDIGKIAVPDAILFKKGELTPDEWKVMKMHPEYAYDLMSPIPFFQNALDIPLYHHEHWDGSGYPRGLRGDKIPLCARLFTMVDVWDALNSDRPYRPAWKPKDVLDFVRQESGKIFDPSLLSLFLTEIGKSHLE
jgi:diguanylate cyclase (GGDEF)-like protein